MAFPTLNRRTNPWGDLLALQNEMNRLFENSMTPSPRAALLATDYVPPVDILRDGDNIVVRVDVPGMKKENLDLSVVNGRLFLRGEKTHESKDEGKHVHRVERFFGRFERVIDLPNPVDADNIRANFKDGVLEIQAPLREEAKPRQISVETN